MFKKNNKEDVILVLLIVVIIVVGGFVMWQNRTNKQEAIKIKKEKNQAQTRQPKEKEANQETTKKLVVHIGGAVVNPGVYKCKEDARLYRVLEKAGGPTKEANLNAINLALPVRDGRKVIIPTKQTRENGTGNNKININTASQTELEKLSGVGPVTAEKIVNYRKQQGRFSNPEALTSVSGIGDKTMAKIKGQITY